MKYLALPLTLFMLLCGCTDTPPDTEQPARPQPTASSNVPDPDVTTNVTSDKAFVKKRYERIEDMATRGVLSCDTVTYECRDAGGGTFTYCSVDGELLRATHEYFSGGHGGGSEVYYYDGPEMFFSLLTQSDWQFAGPQVADADGNLLPSTEDHVKELRTYYAKGAVIDRLYKEYTVKSYAENTPPENIPNMTKIGEIAGTLGENAVQSVATVGSYTCD